MWCARGTGEILTCLAGPWVPWNSGLFAAPTLESPVSHLTFGPENLGDTDKVRSGSQLHWGCVWQCKGLATLIGYQWPRSGHNSSAHLSHFYRKKQKGGAGEERGELIT